MNKQILEYFIDEYKINFDRINDLEIYKWKAVKTFSDNWFSDEYENFNKKLYYSLKSSRNLMASGNYFPRGVMLEVSEKEPEKVKGMFDRLYDESNYYIDRIESFQNEFAELHQELLPEDANHYQDDRAVMVYLSLRFPEKYYLYKYTMFRDFSRKTGMSYKPRAGRIENVSQFMTTCELVNQSLSNHDDLIDMHRNRLNENMYDDSNLNLLTQDLIYAISRHLGNDLLPTEGSDKTYDYSEEKNADYKIMEKYYSFVGQPNMNFAKKQIKNKKIGNAGEIFVLNREKKLLSKTIYEPIHTSKIIGDGVGYDLESYYPDGRKKYIEVKTTKGGFSSQFFVTSNELERSKDLGDSYHLFRVYNFSEETGTGDIKVFKGDLKKFCIHPDQYYVKLKEKTHKPH